MLRPITDDELSEKIADILGAIYAKRIASIKSATISELIGGRNPYLYRAVGPENAAELVADLLSAKAWSSIETVFGNEFFEPLAFWAAELAYSENPTVSVRTSSGGGVDIEIESSSALAAYAIKSGTKIFNAQSRARQIQEFEALRGRLAKTKKFFDPVVGYAYGRKGVGAPRGFREIAGQTLWEELTSDPTFYLRIVSAMGEASRAHAEEYDAEFTAAVNKLAGDFLAEYMDQDGSIDWVRFVEFNSSSARPGRSPKP